MAGIATTNGISTYAKLPTDLKTKVGTGMPFSTKELLLSGMVDYVYNGMVVEDIDKHIFWEYVIDGNRAYWKNLSFGATIFGINSLGTSIKDNSEFTIVSNDNVTFSVLTYGHIENIYWEIVTESQTFTSETPLFITSIEEVGNYTLSLVLTDSFGNIETFSSTLYVVDNTSITITDFIVTPSSSFDGEQQLTFSANLNRNLSPSMISSLRISYPPSTDGDPQNSVNLMNGGAFATGVRLSGTTLIIDNTFSGFLLNLTSDTIFTLSIVLFDSSSGYKYVTYHPVDVVNILEFSASSQIVGTTEVITLPITLSGFPLYSTITGEITAVGGYNGTKSILFSSDTASPSIISTTILDGATTFTLVITQTVNGVSLTDTRTCSISQAYIDLEFITPLVFSPSTLDIGVETSVNVQCTASKNLSGLESLTLVDNTGATKYTFGTIPYETIDTNITLSIDTTKYYRLKATEYDISVVPQVLNTVYSEFALLTANNSNVTVNPVFIGLFSQSDIEAAGLTFGTNISIASLGELTTLIGTIDFETADTVTISGDTGYTSVTEPTIQWETKFINDSWVPQHAWVALPTETPTFTVFNRYRDAQMSPTSMGNFCHIVSFGVTTTTISNVLYTMYILMNYDAPTNYIFSKVN